MNRTIGIILIIAALILGYFGVNKLDDSGGSVNVLGVKISAQDSGAKETAYVMLGLGAICLIGGVTMLNRK